MNETTPLLHRTCIEHVSEQQQQQQAFVDDQSPIIVDFDPNGDDENPLDWPDMYKRGLVLILAFMAFTVTFTCISIIPIADTIAHDLTPPNPSSPSSPSPKSSSVLLVTIWELGEALGPLLLAPLSEHHGRLPTFLAAHTLFTLFTLLAATATSSPTFILSRFLTGLAVASNVLNPAIIGDMYPPDQRGKGMALVMFAPLVGGAVGPAFGARVVQSSRVGWRGLLWICVAMGAAGCVGFWALFRETYGVVILRRRAERVRREVVGAGAGDGNGEVVVKCVFDVVEEEVEKVEAGRESGWMAMRRAVTRPVSVFVSSVVLQMLAVYGALTFTLYYVMATTLPDILRDVYAFSPAEVGTAFLSFSIGALVAIFLCKSLLDRTYTHLVLANNGAKNPEYRLPILIVGAALIPAIVALYGWIPYAHWPVSLLLLAVALLGFALMLVVVPSAAYVVDAFGIYSASAMTMVLIVRCLGGTLLPLAVPPLVERVGLGYAFLAMGSVFLVLMPVPVLVMRYGARWRQSCTFTRSDVY